MDAFGFMAWIVLTWAWLYPEKVGRWLAKVMTAIDGERR